MTSPRSIAILGSTGSIGTQALEVVAANPGRFRVSAISAGGGNLDLLARQAVALGVDAVGVARGEHDLVAAAIHQVAGEAGRQGFRPHIYVGPQASTELAASGADVVLNAITGSIGLRAHPGRARSREHPCPGQQGVPDRRRPAGQGGRQTRADRARRLGAQRSGPVPARRPGRGGAPADRHRQRRPVPRPEPSELEDVTPSRRSTTRPGPWARSSRSTRRRWSTRAWR